MGHRSRRDVGRRPPGAGDTLNIGQTRPLSDVLSELREAFDVSADGQRFLLLATPEEKSTLPITLVQNWVPGLRN